MKTGVILIVLFASLLVVTGAAFALPLPSCCEDACYEVTGTDLTNPANSFTQHWSFCFSDDIGVACNQPGSTFLFAFSSFFQSLIDQVISFQGNAAYIKFHGSDDDIFNGLYYLSGDQYNIHGVEEPCPDGA